MTAEAYREYVQERVNLPVLVEAASFVLVALVALGMIGVQPSAYVWQQFVGVSEASLAFWLADGVARVLAPPVTFGLLLMSLFFIHVWATDDQEMELGVQMPPMKR